MEKNKSPTKETSKIEEKQIQQKPSTTNVNV